MDYTALHIFFESNRRVALHGKLMKDIAFLFAKVFPLLASLYSRDEKRILCIIILLDVMLVCWRSERVELLELWLLLFIFCYFVVTFKEVYHRKNDAYLFNGEKTKHIVWLNFSRIKYRNRREEAIWLKIFFSILQILIKLHCRNGYDRSKVSWWNSELSENFRLEFH